MLCAAIHVDFKPQIMLWINVMWLFQRFQGEDAASAVADNRNKLINKNDIIFALHGISVGTNFYTLIGLFLLTSFSNLLLEHQYTYINLYILNNQAFIFEKSNLYI